MKTQLDKEKLQPPLVISRDLLSEEAVQGLIREFILREGTDYGHADPAFEEKIKKVQKQIDVGSAMILFDPNTESCTLLRKEQLTKMGVKYGV